MEWIGFGCFSSDVAGLMHGNAPKTSIGFSTKTMKRTTPGTLPHGHGVIVVVDVVAGAAATGEALRAPGPEPRESRGRVPSMPTPAPLPKRRRSFGCRMW